MGQELGSKGILGKGLSGPVVLTNVADFPCQQRVDPKAFTGRGGRAALVQAQRDVDKVHAAMNDLVRKTHDVPGRLMYLCIHSRSATGQKSLRWRESGEGGAHLSWAAAPQRAKPFGPAIAAWYSLATRNALALNSLEKQARAALRSILERHP